MTLDKHDIKARFFELDSSDQSTLLTAIQSGLSLGDSVGDSNTAYQVPEVPEVPGASTVAVQDVVDALITLGLITQAEE